MGRASANPSAKDTVSLHDEISSGKSAFGTIDFEIGVTKTGNDFRMHEPHAPGGFRKPRLTISGTDRQYNTVAAIADQGDWRLFRPFHEGRIAAAACVGEDRFACLSKTGELCLIDWRLGREIARVDLPAESASISRLFVTADAETIVIYQHRRPHDEDVYLHSLRVVRAATLETVVAGDGLDWSDTRSTARLVEGYVHPRRPGAPINITIHSPLFEDPAGRLAFVGFDCGPSQSRFGLCRLDRSDGSLSHEPLPDAAGGWWPSPSGRYAVTPASGAPPVHHGSADEAVRHRDVAADGIRRVGRALDLWTTTPLGVVATLVARMEPEPLLVIRDVVWEPDETGFWIHQGYFWDKRSAFRRVGLDGSLSPVFGFQRLDGTKLVAEIADVSDPRHVGISVVPDAVFIPRAWCASDAPTRTISVDEDGFRPSAWAGPKEAAVRRFLSRSNRRHVVAIDAFSETAIAEGLRGLAQTVRTRLADLVEGDRLELFFKVGGRTMTETAFFARLARARVPVAPMLRDLLTAYLAAQPAVVDAKKLYRQIWGAKAGQGALAPAMQALLRLDPTAHDVFRDYLAKRDGEHEIHTTDVMMATYIRETGWRDRAMIGFGIYVALIRHRDGLIDLGGGLLGAYGLLDAAETLIDPEAFAELMLEELDRFVAYPDMDCRFGPDELYAGLRAGLRPTPYGARVIAALAARRVVSRDPEA